MSKQRNDNFHHFPVVGAGEIEVGTHDEVKCGDAIGVHFGVSWGTYGYAGGVMDVAEVDRLIACLQSLRARADESVIAPSA